MQCLSVSKETYFSVDQYQKRPNSSLYQHQKKPNLSLYQHQKRPNLFVAQYQRDLIYQSRKRPNTLENGQAEAETVNQGHSHVAVAAVVVGEVVRHQHNGHARPRQLHRRGVQGFCLGLRVQGSCIMDTPGHANLIDEVCKS
jgi:hypothetical protein